MKNQHFFWISYSDLMTTLFFIMLVLFAVCYSVVKQTEIDRKEYQELSKMREQVKKANEELQAQQIELEESQKEVKIAQDKYKKITDLTNSVKDLPDKWFKYNDKYKKHILKINVRFKPGSDDLEDSSDLKSSLVNSGEEIKKLIDSKYKLFGTPFLVVIEGQASKGGWPEDNSKRNDILSYKRARSLVSFWEQNGINLRSGSYNEKCELIIAGSGENGVMRETDDDSKNQRFLIHILAKPGEL